MARRPGKGAGSTLLQSTKQTLDSEQSIELGGLTLKVAVILIVLLLCSTSGCRSVVGTDDPGRSAALLFLPPLSEDQVSADGESVLGIPNLRLLAVNGRKVTVETVSEGKVPLLPGKIELLLLGTRVGWAPVVSVLEIEIEAGEKFYLLPWVSGEGGVFGIVRMGSPNGGVAARSVSLAE